MLVCADSAQLVISWARRWGRYRCADMLAALDPLDLELDFAHWWELLRDALRDGWLFPTLHFVHSSSHWVECDNLGVVESVCSLCQADPSSLWFHDRFSCVSAFVLFWHVPARGQILVSISSAVFPLSLKHIYVTRGFTLIISCSLYQILSLVVSLNPTSYPRWTGIKQLL